MPDTNLITIDRNVLTYLFARITISNVHSYNGTPCWESRVGLMRKSGYARFTVNAIRDYSHRIMYALFVEPLCAGLTIDHLCRVRRCCNPIHLEQVTLTENTLRGESIFAKQKRQTHCKRGHDLADALLYHGQRRCRLCASLRQMQSRTTISDVQRERNRESKRRYKARKRRERLGI